MAKEPGKAEIKETVVDVKKLEQVVAVADKNRADAATIDIVEAAAKETGEMEGITETPKMKEIIEEPAATMADDAGTSNISTEEDFEGEGNMESTTETPLVERNIEEIRGFRQRYLEDLKSYYKERWNSSEVDDGRGKSGFYRVQRRGSEDLYEPTYVNFPNIRDMLENDNPDVKAQKLLRHYYDHLFLILLCNESKSVEDYLQMIYQDRGLIAYYYAEKDKESIDFPFWLSLLLSGCFIIHLLSKPFNAPVPPVEEDPEFALLWAHDLWVDLLLLENQIPFITLQRIYKMAMISESGSLMDREIYDYFADFIPLNRLNSEQFRPLHLLHYVHQSLLPDKKSDRLSFFSTMVNLLEKKLIKKSGRLSFFSTMVNFLEKKLIKKSDRLSFFSTMVNSSEKKQSSSQPPMMRVIPTATRLQEAGVEFMPVEEKGFVVEFRKGVLRLPSLQARRSTKKLLKNLIAWEQYHQEAVKYVINYAILMDHLVNTSKDIEVLIQNKILEHSLGTDEDAASIFNDLGKNLVFTINKKDNEEYDFLPQLSKDLNNYCQIKSHRWMSNLQRVYFKNPWTIISLIAGGLLILLTIAQTFFSADSYFRPPK